MVQVKPFKAIRPNKELADKVASLPYDVVNREEAEEFAKDNPYSYLHIDRSEIDLPEEISPYDEKVYQKAAENLQKFMENNWLVQDNTNNFYLYRLTMNGRSQTGLVSATSVEDYAEGRIKKHELTRPEKEEDRINHIKACDANTSPIFLTYRDDTTIQQITTQWIRSHDAVYDFKSYYDVRHEVWIIDNEFVNNQLSELFEAKVGALYIADGHHRAESAAKVSQALRESGESKNGESDYFLSVIFPQSELDILSYNRLLNDHVPEDFMDRLTKHFEVSEITSSTFTPKQKHEFCMYIDGKWYQLLFDQTLLDDLSYVESLDANILQNYLFDEIFDIDNPRVDERLEFVGGIYGTKRLSDAVDAGEAKIAFVLYPTLTEEIMKVADLGEIMPPKSTWFEPKLLSGLFLHDLETK